MKHLSSFEKKSNFSRHFKGWKFIRLCILCYIFVFLHQLFLSLPLWSICFDKFYKKNCICEVGIYFIFRNPYIALSIKVSRRRQKEIFVWKNEENLVVSKLKITRSSISPIGERGYLMFFKSHRIFLPFVLHSLIEHEILVKFTFVI